jgi:hypothetical protein
MSRFLLRACRVEPPPTVGKRWKKRRTFVTCRNMKSAAEIHCSTVLGGWQKNN